jgi:uncharacterized membrane protein
LEAGRREEALAALEAWPSAEEWRVASGQLALWIGVVCLCAGVIFFFAFNWEGLGRLEKVGLGQLALLGMVAGYVYKADDRVASSALLAGVSLMIGALFALVGQVYQSGADAWELFAVWALFVVPLAAISRSGAQYVIALCLINTGAGLFLEQLRLANQFKLLGPAPLTAMLGVLNVALWVAWFVVARGRVEWMEKLLWLVAGCWLAFASCATLADAELGWSVALYVAWVAGCYGLYRRRRVSRGVLAGMCASLLVTYMVLFVRLVIEVDLNELLIPFFWGPLGTLSLVGFSALCGSWLKGLHVDEVSEQEASV